MFYLAKVKMKVEDDNGKIKTKTFSHLVEDESIVGVQARITEDYSDSVSEWELVSVVETKIVSVLLAGE